MFDKAFGEIDKAYIESLIEDEVVEAKHLDYKETLPGDTDREKNRFVEDICAFANAAGGDIVFGLAERKDTAEEKTGTPVYVGLKGVNFDQEKLRLEHIILNKIEPRILGIQFRPPIEGFPDGPVLVMRIPRSYNAPHMTKHDGRFHSRTDSGNYAMDVQEIRSAFIASEALPELIRQFRAERLAKIVAGETPVRLNNGPKMILHVVPISLFGRRELYDLQELYDRRADIVPIGGAMGSEYNGRYNFDGILSFCPSQDDGAARSYTQVFRNGVVEAVDADLIQRGAHEKGISRAYEDDVLSALRVALRVQKMIGVEPPLTVMLGLLGVAGYRIVGWLDAGRDLRYGPIDRDYLLSDGVIIEEYGVHIDTIMRPVLDAVANTAGWPRSLSYDKEGNRIKRT
jgi:hypothetical protein